MRRTRTEAVASPRGTSRKKATTVAPASPVGSTLDELLEEDGTLDAASSAAIKRVVAWQVAEAIKAAGMSKVDMAKRMQTSRSALERLLDPANGSVTLQTLSKAASVLGKRLRGELVDPAA
jgi:antitoxin HicB